MISYILNSRCKLISLFLILAVVLPFTLSGCGPQKIIRKNSRLQHFVDETEAWFPKFNGPLKFARFVRANRDALSDLLILRDVPDKGPVLEIWLNKDEDRFEPAERFWKGEPGDRITQLEVGDFNRDGTHDAVLVGQFADGSRARLLTNNGKGYYFIDKRKPLPVIDPSMKRLQVVDLDQDHFQDLIFFNTDPSKGPGADYQHPVQFLLNKGEGVFQERTNLLWPKIPAGMAGGVYTDYDGDKTLDAFLYYGSGRNALLLNNGLGQLTDATHTSLPRIKNKAVHSDWADFDQDGDQDLIVLTRELSVKGRESGKELHYGLENNGQGYFTKRTLKFMPPFPATGTYLLDGDGDEWADMILTSPRGTFYLRGTGKWKFSVETRKRLPGRQAFKEITFGDINDDGYLDLFAITPKGRGYLWVNEF